MDEMSLSTLNQKSQPNLIIDILKQGECRLSPARVSAVRPCRELKENVRHQLTGEEAAAAPNQILGFSRIDFATHRATNTFNKSSVTHLDVLDIFSLVKSLRIHMLT